MPSACVARSSPPMRTVPLVGRLRLDRMRISVRLARAVRPEDDERFARHDAQVDPAQRVLRPERLDEVAHLDHRDVGFAHPHASCRDSLRIDVAQLRLQPHPLDRGTPIRRFRRLRTPGPAAASASTSSSRSSRLACNGGVSPRRSPRERQRHQERGQRGDRARSDPRRTQPVQSADAGRRRRRVDAPAA